MGSQLAGDDLKGMRVSDFAPRLRRVGIIITDPTARLCLAPIVFLERGARLVNTLE